MSFTYTKTFTTTHARYLASKVIADLYQCSLLYDNPTAGSVGVYEEELTTLLADRYVAAYEFGFKRNEKRVLTWHYTVGTAGDLEGDVRSGGPTRAVDIADAQYFNLLTYSGAWSALSPAERNAIEEKLPFRRTLGSGPEDGSGYWVSEQSYSAGGVLVARRVFRPW